MKRWFNMSRLIALRVVALLVVSVLSGCASWPRVESSVAIVPHDYSLWQRVVGIYPLVNDAISHSTQRDALGIPVIDAQSLQSLSRSHAPIFRIETVGPYDRFGALTLKLHGANSIDDWLKTRVDIASPAVYVRHDSTCYGFAICVCPAVYI